VVAYGVDASPALAVAHALLELAPRWPALVVSGINYGANLGIEVTISGTVGAALEAGAFGVPALAVSLEMDARYHRARHVSADYRAAQAFTCKFAEFLLTHAMRDDVDVLNLNIPADATPETPWCLTRLSRLRYFLPLAPDRAAGQGRPGYRLIDDPSLAEPGSDIRATCHDRAISVTPLSLDLTARVPLPEGACSGAEHIDLLSLAWPVRPSVEVRR
jgi:5'-nucleotidase